jgi:hypothetical protein
MAPLRACGHLPSKSPTLRPRNIITSAISVLRESTPTKKEDIVKALKDSYAFAHQAIETITAENAFQQFGDHKVTRAGLAAMALAHTNDHYGQMVVYLRMNKIIPPASRKP